MEDSPEASCPAARRIGFRRSGRAGACLSPGPSPPENTMPGSELGFAVREAGRLNRYGVVSSSCELRRVA